MKIGVSTLMVAVGELSRGVEVCCKVKVVGLEICATVVWACVLADDKYSLLVCTIETDADVAASLMNGLLAVVITDECLVGVDMGIVVVASLFNTVV